MKGSRNLIFQPELGLSLCIALLLGFNVPSFHFEIPKIEPLLGEHGALVSYTVQRRCVEQPTPSGTWTPCIPLSVFKANVLEQGALSPLSLTFGKSAPREARTPDLEVNSLTL
jgi:hypothetical protein